MRTQIFPLYTSSGKSWEDYMGGICRYYSTDAPKEIDFFDQNAAIINMFAMCRPCHFPSLGTEGQKIVVDQIG